VLEGAMAKVDENKLHYILSTIQELEYGSVSITIHDNEITQVDSTEKRRFPPVKKETKRR